MSTETAPLSAVRVEPVVGRNDSDKCPECGGPMLYDAGESMTREHPGAAPCIFCGECGSEYPVECKRIEAPNAIVSRAHDKA